MADDEVTRAKDMAGRKRNTDMLPWRIVLAIKILWYDGDFAETDVMQHGVVSVQVRVFVSLRYVGHGRPRSIILLGVSRTILCHVYPPQKNKMTAFRRELWIPGRIIPL